MSTVTKPIALDETLQSTNTALGFLGKDTTLQAIATAIANVGLSNIGNMSSLATTDKTSLVSAINEVVGDVSDLDTDKADKVSSSTNGNLAGLDANGNLTDSGVSASSIGNLSGSHTGICETAASTSAKIVTIGDGTWIPKEGDIIGVKFTYSNTALFVTLNVNGIGNKGIWYGDSVDPSGADYICGKAGSYIFYMYDGTYWIWLNEGQHDGNNFPSVAVYTDSNQQVKIGTCNYYTLTNKSYCHFIFRYPNTYKGELFIKINNSSSKTIYINGEISSSTNYTLPAGTYIAYYENDKWYFRNDGKLTANITGTAASDSTKADKVASATNGNLAGLNASGNLTDSGWASDKTTTSASGNPISITGLKSNQLAVNPVITFEPIQAGSGDPSPSNVRAISGYDKIEVLSCGVNVWDEEWELGTYSTTDGSPVSGTSNIRSKSNKPIIVEGNTKYYSRISLGGRLFFYDSADQYINNTTTANNEFTTPANAKYLRFHVSTDYRTKYNNNISINYPSTQTSYVASNKTTDLSEPLPQTVYGGTLDVRTGKLTVTHGIVDLGTLSWTYYNNYFAKLSNMKKLPELQTSLDKCSMYNVEYNGNSKTHNDKNYVIYAEINTLNIYIRDTTVSSTSDLVAKVTGQKLVYELATPFTIQLTPHEISLLKDYAYVSTNGTSIALDYHNGEIATLGDVSQLGETVEGLGKHLTPVGYGTPEIITPDANYTVPSMGFVTIQAAKNAVITFWNYTPGINRGFIISGGASNANTCVIPVFGGMIVKVIQSSGTADAVFYPYKYADA